jgi:CRP-like cAMP-binding protein
MTTKPAMCVPLKEPYKDSNGKAVTNKILLSLPEKEYTEVMSALEFVRMPLHQVVYEAGEIIKSCYFVNTGLMSVIAVQPDGKGLEVGLIGREGFVGSSLLVGYRTSPTRVVVQGDLTAYRCDGEVLRSLARECRGLEQALYRFVHRIAMQTMQLAACNSLHDVEERLARWILMSQDRIESEHLPLTQEFLAQMLGTRRSSVTVSAGILAKAGLIAYSRGNLTVLNREGLEDSACDCYQLIQRQIKDWESEHQ